MRRTFPARAVPRATGLRVATALLLGGLCATSDALAQGDEPTVPVDPAPDPATPAEAELATEPPAPPPPASAPVPEPEASPAPPQAQPVSPPPQAPPARELPPPPPPEDYRYEGQVDPDEDDGFGDGGYAADERQDEPDGGSGFEMPGFSIRLDPFNWLLEGRLGFEVEVAVWKLLTVELVPVFVANEDPPVLDYASRDDSVTQHGNGLGDLAGTSLGVGFWLAGRPFQGYVLRAILTNYSYEYKSRDGAGVYDRVKHTERHLMALFGSQSRWGFFTIGGAIGLGYELNQQERCDLQVSMDTIRGVDDGCDGVLAIALERRRSDPDPSDPDRRFLRAGDVNGPFHPVYLVGRFSLGVAFD